MVALPLCLINIYSLSILSTLTVNPYSYSDCETLQLLEYYSEFLGAFDRLKAEKLLPLRSPGTNYTIKLEKVDKKEPIVT